MTHRLERALAGVVATAPAACGSPCAAGRSPDLVVNPITRATLGRRPARAYAARARPIVGGGSVVAAW